MSPMSDQAYERYLASLRKPKADELLVEIVDSQKRTIAHLEEQLAVYREALAMVREHLGLAAKTDAA